jgi:hypothetical protein
MTFFLIVKQQSQAHSSSCLYGTIILLAMAENDHQKVIDEVIELARQQLKQDGRLDFTVLTIDEQGQTACMDIDTASFRSEAKKDRLKGQLRREFRKKGIVRYALVAECWRAKMKPIPSVPVRSENLEHYLDRYADEYSRMGYSPSEGRGRDEIILVQVCDRMRTTLRIWKIERFLLTGVVRDLVPVDLGNDAESTFGGRFVNLLEGQVH